LSQLPRLALVLDTNVVLDWLLFGDPSATPISAAIESQQVRWIATAAMREELAEVLRRGLAASRGVDPRAVLRAWDEHADLIPEPPRQPAALALRCTDPDDQKFLDLARAERALWLLSRDRAVLRLARRAAALGIRISVPERWSLSP
jgi:predicted nucleic acid-binding protein